MPSPQPPAHLTEGLSSLLFRDLTEIYLLIDYISSRCETKLPATLEIGGGKHAGKEDWIAAVAAITWPPTGTSFEIGQKAGLLIKVRDALNRCVSPATGASIAFTIMTVIDDEMDKLDDGGELAPPAPLDGGAGSLAEHASGPLAAKTHLTQSLGAERRKVARRSAARARFMLARDAFPSLHRPARRFAMWNNWLIAGLATWLFLTLLLSWYVALGSNLVLQAYTARKEFDAANSPPAAASVSNAKGASAGSGAGSVVVSNGSQQQWQFLCNRVVATRVSVSSFVDPFNALPLSPPDGSKCNAEDGGVAATSVPVALGTPFFAVAWFNLLGGSMLPAAYGLLGACASAVRGVSAKMKACTLTERDLKLSIIQIVLGAVIGACIGLFMQPATNNDPKNTVGLLGVAFLGASALSFLAGFGVEHVFGVLDGVLTRAFSIGKSGEKGASPT